MGFITFSTVLLLQLLFSSLVFINIQTLLRFMMVMTKNLVMYHQVIQKWAAVISSKGVGFVMTLTLFMTPRFVHLSKENLTASKMVALINCISNTNGSLLLVNCQGTNIYFMFLVLRSLLLITQNLISCRDLFIYLLSSRMVIQFSSLPWHPRLLVPLQIFFTQAVVCFSHQEQLYIHTQTCTHINNLVSDGAHLIVVSSSHDDIWLIHNLNNIHNKS